MHRGAVSCGRDRPVWSALRGAPPARPARRRRARDRGVPAQPGDALFLDPPRGARAVQDRVRVFAGAILAAAYRGRLRHRRHLSRGRRASPHALRAAAGDGRGPADDLRVLLHVRRVIACIWADRSEHAASAEAHRQHDPVGRGETTRQSCRRRLRDRGAVRPRPGRDDPVRFRRRRDPRAQDRAVSTRPRRYRTSRSGIRARPCGAGGARRDHVLRRPRACLLCSRGRTPRRERRAVALSWSRTATAVRC